MDKKSPKIDFKELENQPIKKEWLDADRALGPGSILHPPVKKEPENPPAFACVDPNYLQEGMSLRDYFAAKAMPHCQRSYWDGRGLDYENNAGDAQNIAEQSYLMADAMLKERSKNK